MSVGLVHRIIAESGDAMARWSIYRPPDKNLPCTTELARQVNCTTDTTPGMLECLRQIDANVLVNAPVSVNRLTFCWGISG